MRLTRPKKRKSRTLAVKLLCAASVLLPVTGLLWAQGDAVARRADAAFHAGYADLAANRLEDARTEFEKVVSLEPRVEEGHSALGAVLLQLNLLPQAIAELRTAVRLKPQDEAAQTNLAMAYSQNSQEALAVPIFARIERAGKQLPPDVLVAYARTLAMTGAIQTATQKLQTAVLVSPADAQLHDTLGMLYAQQQKWAPAGQEFDTALHLDASLAGAHLHLGTALLAQQQMEAALRELNVAAQLEPENPVVQLTLGKALVAAGEDEPAIAALNRALALNSHSDETIYELALAYQGAGRPKDALPLFTQASKAKPEDADRLTNLAFDKVQLGDAAGAVPLFQKALQLAPASVSTREDLGVAYLQQNHLDDAIREFEAGLELDHDNPQLHYNLGLAYKLKDNIDRAIPELETAARLDPSAPDAPLTLGILFMQEGRFADAVAHLKTGVQLRPENGDGWALLGSVYRQNHQLPEAVAALTEAIRLLPDQPGPHITLAGALSDEGKQGEASAERKAAANLTRTAINHQRATFAASTGNGLMARGQVADAVQRYQEAVNSDPDYVDAHRSLALALTRQGRIREAEEENQKADQLQTRQSAAR